MVKIIIIGAGISGLSTYLFLRKHLLLNNPSQDHEISIYEAYDIKQSAFNATLNGTVKGERDHTLPTDETEPIFTPQAIGSAIGISKNGLSVLSRLDETLPDAKSGHGGCKSIISRLATHGHPIERWEISTARGFTIVDVNLAPPKNKSNSSKAEDQAASKKRDLYHGIMIARQAAWEILRDAVLAVSPDVVLQKKVVDVVIGDGTRRNIVKFKDGSEEEADLVIGADGLRSVVRRAMFRENVDSKTGVPITKEKKTWTRSLATLLPFSRTKDKDKKTDFVSPHYEGLVGVGGFVPSSVIQATGHKPGTMSIVFGPNGFFGYGYLTSAPTSSSSSSEADTSRTATTSTNVPISPPGPLAGWWSTFSSTNPFPYDTSPTRPNYKGFNKPLALSSLLTRHSRWSNPSISAIISYVKSDTEIHGANGKGLDASYPTWTTPELPHWQVNGRVVLVGDAAHALQPSSGQGACQALEDAETLAILLGHYLAAPSSSSSVTSTKASPPPRETTTLLTAPSSPSLSTTALARALESYQTIRTPRVHKIHAHSQKMSNLKSDMNMVMEYTVYFMIWMMTLRWLNWVLNRLGISDMERYNDELFGYDLPREVERFL